MDHPDCMLIQVRAGVCLLPFNTFTALDTNGALIPWKSFFRMFSAYGKFTFPEEMRGYMLDAFVHFLEVAFVKYFHLLENF